MFIVSYRRLGLFKIGNCYFAEELPAAADYHIISVKCCYSDLPYKFPYEQKKSQTILIDLSGDAETLWRKVKKNRRDMINRSSKIGFKMVLEKPTNAVLEEFRRMHNQFIPRRGGDHLGGIGGLVQLKSHMMVFRFTYEGETVEMYLCLVNGRNALGWLMARRENHPNDEVNKCLGTFGQWEINLHLNRLGFEFIDLGGAGLEPDSPYQGIAKFKLSFGGKIVPSYSYRAMNPTLHAILKGGTRFTELLPGKIKALINRSGFQIE